MTFPIYGNIKKCSKPPTSYKAGNKMQTVSCLHRRVATPIWGAHLTTQDLQLCMVPQFAAPQWSTKDSQNQFCNTLIKYALTKGTITSTYISKQCFYQGSNKSQCRFRKALQLPHPWVEMPCGRIEKTGTGQHWNPGLGVMVITQR